MSLLDEVTYSQDKQLRARATVKADNPFLVDGHLPIWVGIEYMAQAVAAYAGLDALKKGEEVKLGFLVGTRKYKSQGTKLAIGSKIKISIEESLWGENGLGAFQCELQGEDPSGHRCTAQASLNVYQPNSIEDIIKGGM
ncbi:hypothetical protein [uncultured Pseudoteredinibacter sp.]|uniref:ApeP family dehydratase n=1 Tax=uncultured Pseudoteredinibacter sp. TaxID=1641701 RepID=UPI00261DDBAF|nr:hypothetical protein [uncultured Pseudoteredinibacter sp.]